MSAFQCIASKSPLPTVKNNYQKISSINDLRAAGISEAELDHLCAHATENIDPDKKIFFQCMDVERANDLEIFPCDSEKVPSSIRALYSENTFFYEFYLHNSENSLFAFYNYLKTLAKNISAIDIFSIWLDDPAPFTESISSFFNLALEDLKFLNPPYDKNYLFHIYREKEA